MSNLTYSPFRSFADFFLSAEKYEMPAMQLKKFNNRVVSNLLYYQTNYIFVEIGFFLLFLFLGFKKLLIGSVAVAPAIALALRHFGKTSIFDQIQQQNSNAVIIIALAEIIILYLAYNHVCYFLLTVALPTGLVILHAAFRKRNVKNKANNAMEKISGAIYDNTPMECLLKVLGIEATNYRE